MWYYGLTCVPSLCPLKKDMLESSSSSECDLIWRWRLCRGNQIKMKSQGGPLSIMADVLIRRGNMAERKDWRDTGRRWLSTGQGEKSTRDPSLRTLKRNKSCWHLDFRLLTSLNYCCFSHPFVVLCYSSTRKQTQVVNAKLLEDYSGEQNFQSMPLFLFFLFGSYVSFLISFHVAVLSLA